MMGFGLSYPSRAGLRRILEGVDLAIPAGRLVLLAGPSGSGKSSLVAAFLGLEDPFAPQSIRRGRLEVLGHEVHGPLAATLRARLGAVFQEGALLDDLSPRANLELVARAHQLPTARIDELLQQVELPRLPERVTDLSGGERRRLALARALLRAPELLILDEPTAGLDPSTSARIAQLVRHLHDRQPGRTTLVISHDLAIFAPLADLALALDPRRGALIELAPSELPSALVAIDAARPAATAVPANSSSTNAVTNTSGPRNRSGRMRHAAWRAWLALGEPSFLIPRILRHILAVTPRRLLEKLRDLLLVPAPYYAFAALAGGALATTFALRNNPLEEALRREILMGVGKVQVGTFLPLLIGILFAARTAAGEAARLGALRRAQVFEALPLLGIAPFALLVAPFVLASLVTLPVLTAVAIVCGSVASLAATTWLTELSPPAWAAASFSLVQAADLRWVLGRSLVSAALVALVTVHLATRPQRSAEDVARATRGALVWSTLLVLLAHGLLIFIEQGTPA